MKRNLFLSIVVFISFLGMAFLYFYLKDQRKPKLTSIETLPKSCEIFIETVNIHQLLKKTKHESIIWDEIKKSSFFSDLDQPLSGLDSLLENNSELSELLEEKKISLAGVKLKSKLEFLLCIQVDNLASEKSTVELLKRNFKTFLKENKAESIYTLEIQKGKKIHCAFKSGILMISKSKNVILETLNCNKENSLAADTYFLSLYEKSGSNNDINLIYRNDFLEEKIKKILAQNTKEKIQIEINFGFGWSALDFKLNTIEVTFSGFTKFTNSNFFNSLSEQEPVSIKFIDAIPACTKNFAFLGISEYKKFFTNRLETSNEKLLNLLDSFNSILDADFATELEQIFSGEIVMVRTQDMETENSYGLIGFKELEPCKEFLKKIAQNENDSVFALREKSLFSLVSAGTFNAEFKYARLVKDYILLSSTVESLNEFTKSIVSGGTFSRSNYFERIQKSNYASECNFFIHSEFSESISFLKQYLNEEVSSELEKNKSSFKNFSAFGWQISKNNSGPLSLGYLLYSSSNNNHNFSIWEAQLDTTCSQVPQQVINHKTGGKEILIQDDANHLYQINNLGKINWKKKLSEKIKGKIVQIDFFKNEKLQYLFNTENFLHLIDRNGNELDGYPLKFPSKATASISTFDYESNKDYRVIVPCENKKIYNYKLQDSSLTEGFNFPDLESACNLPVQHLRIGSKDYLLAIDYNGKIYLTNRKGENRILIPTILKNTSTFPAIYVANSIEKSFIQVYDPQNKILQKIHLNGNTEEKSVETENRGKTILFDYLDEDVWPELILADESGFEVLNEVGKCIQKQELKEEMSGKIALLKKQDKLFFAQETNLGDLMLFNEDNLRLKGSSMPFGNQPVLIELNNDNTFYLINTIKDKLYCFPLEEN